MSLKLAHVLLYNRVKNAAQEYSSDASFGNNVVVGDRIQEVRQSSISIKQTGYDSQDFQGGGTQQRFTFDIHSYGTTYTKVAEMADIIFNDLHNLTLSSTTYEVIDMQLFENPQDGYESVVTVIVII
jgi:hypothetical protein